MITDAASPFLMKPLTQTLADSLQIIQQISFFSVLKKLSSKQFQDHLITASVCNHLFITSIYIYHTCLFSLQLQNRHFPASSHHSQSLLQSTHYKYTCELYQLLCFASHASLLKPPCSSSIHILTLVLLSLFLLDIEGGGWQ